LNNIPYITVTKATKFCKVNLDMVSTKSNLSEIGMELIKRRYEIEHDYLESKHHPKTSKIRWTTSEGKESCYYEKIYIKRVDDFCNRIFDIAMKYNKPLLSL